MATQKIGTAEKPKPLSDRQLARMCALYAELDAERLDFDRQSRARTERLRLLAADLDAQRKLSGAAIIDLARYEFGVELVAGSLSYKDELIKAIGFDEFEKRKAAVPQREKFFLREKNRPKTRRPASDAA